MENCHGTARSMWGLTKALSKAVLYVAFINHGEWDAQQLIFSGYDGHRDDQGVGVTEWTEADYAAMTGEVLALSRRASCPVLSMHGGGYHLESAVTSAVVHVGVLAGRRSPR